MDDNSRLILQKMIKENDVEDQTDLIRTLKHSEYFRTDINNLLLLKKKYNNNQELIINDAFSECNFLFTYYTDIFNKIRKDEIDLKILFEFISVLKKIENGEMDQHDGSFVVGKLLKELYVDSALRKAEKLDLENEKNTVKIPVIEPININWKQFKQNKQFTQNK